MKKLLAGSAFLAAAIFGFLVNLVTSFTSVQLLAGEHQPQVYTLMLVCGCVGLALAVVGGGEIKKRDAAMTYFVAKMEQKLSHLQQTVHQLADSANNFNQQCEAALQQWTAIKAAGGPDYREQLKEVLQALTQSCKVETGVLHQVNNGFRDTVSDLDNAMQYLAGYAEPVAKQSRRELEHYMRQLKAFEAQGQAIVTHLSGRLTEIEQLRLGAELGQSTMLFCAELRRALTYLGELVSMCQRLRHVSKELLHVSK